MKLTVRVIRTYEVDVDAVYGDTPETLVERGLATLKPSAKPVAETAVLLDEEHS